MPETPYSPGPCSQRYDVDGNHGLQNGSPPAFGPIHARAMRSLCIVENDTIGQRFDLICFRPNLGKTMYRPLATLRIFRLRAHAIDGPIFFLCELSLKTGCAILLGEVGDADGPLAGHGKSPAS